MKKLRVGVIGLGVGTRHVAGYVSHPLVEIAALCDVDEATLAEVGKQYPDAVLMRDAFQLLHDEAIDAVSIASYDGDHYEQIIAAIKAGKHVFAEKPLCLLSQHAQNIQQALMRRSDLVLSSHFPLRSTPRFLELLADVRAGRYGRLYYASADYNYGRLEKLTDGWRGRTDNFSIVLGGGVHPIDLLLQLAESDVVEVTAVGNKIASAGTVFRYDDLVTSTLRFADGMLATVTCNGGNASPHFIPLRVFGTAAVFEHAWQGALRFTSRNPHDAPEPITAAFRQERQAETTPLIHSFVNAALTGSVPLVTADEIFRGLAVCFAIIASAEQQGRPVAVRYPERHRV